MKREMDVVRWSPRGGPGDDLGWAVIVVVTRRGPGEDIPGWTW